jgi:hypothetical protein
MPPHYSEGLRRPRVTILKPLKATTACWRIRFRATVWLMMMVLIYRTSILSARLARPALSNSLWRARTAPGRPGCSPGRAIALGRAANCGRMGNPCQAFTVPYSAGTTVNRLVTITIRLPPSADLRRPERRRPDPTTGVWVRGSGLQ